MTGPQISWSNGELPILKTIVPNSICLYYEADQLKAIIKNTHGEVTHKDLSDLPEAQNIIQLMIDDASYSCLSLKQEQQIRRALKVPYRGVLLPFVEGINAYNEDGSNNLPIKEIAESLIEIYAESRLIITDYEGEGNLIKESDTNKIRCVDFDESISCDSPRARNRFFNGKDAYTKYRDDCWRYDKHKLGTQVNLSLLYIEKHLEKYLFPKEILNKYMTPAIIFALNEFQENSIPLTMKTLDILLLLTQTYPEHKLHLSAQSIHSLEMNTDSFSAIEAICAELNEKQLTESKENYARLIEPEALAHFIQLKNSPLQEQKLEGGF